MPTPRWLTVLNQELITCTLCPRLVEYRETIGRVKRRAYKDQEYWAKPVPGFGDPNARVVVLGLAPGAHGSNRTGRPFTGDGSGYFMYRLLHQAGFANQPTATRRGDGLQLHDMYITAVGRCAPPANKPTPKELDNCTVWLDRELAGLKEARVIVVLGKIAFDSFLRHLRRTGQLMPAKKPVFGHGVESKLADGRILLCSYHPSLQNTNTGKLTEKMMLDMFRKAKRIVDL
jgi:uracil-DNA glycosylase